jgi:hypothetical protein
MDGFEIICISLEMKGRVKISDLSNDVCINGFKMWHLLQVMSCVFCGQFI